MHNRKSTEEKNKTTSPGYKEEKLTLTETVKQKRKTTIEVQFMCLHTVLYQSTNPLEPSPTHALVSLFE